MKENENISASVKQRLLNISRTDERPFMENLQYYAIERFLYRLSQSVYAENYILKGALMLKVWNFSEARSTMDIDMLGKTGNDIQNIVSQIKDILSLEIEPDGLFFDLDTIQTERITEDLKYKGIKVKFQVFLGTARVNMQIDIGFGDIVYPKPSKQELPGILKYPTPFLLCYSKESVIAEKFDAMISHGMLNSRIKDFHDIWVLSRQFEFNFSSLSKAVKLTFNKRGTIIQEPIEAFSSEFILVHQKMWISFCRRVRTESIPVSFENIIDDIKNFLMPVISNSDDFSEWQPGGPWR